MLSFSVWFNIRFPKPKSILTVIQFMLVQIGPIGSSHQRLHRKNEKEIKAIPIYPSIYLPV